MSKKKANSNLLFIFFVVAASISVLLILFVCVNKIILRPENMLNKIDNVNIFKQSDDIDFDKLEVGKVSLRLEQVLERKGSRPDLGAKQPHQDDSDLYTSDLNPGLRPVRLLVSDIDDRVRDSGNSCDVAVFPHRCTLNLSAAEQGKSKTVLIKVVFADKKYAEKEIVVPFVGMLEDPTILAPKVFPKDGDSMETKFKDVGASEYQVGIHICREYNNDGINPCLNGGEYFLVRKGQKLILRDSGSNIFSKSASVSIDNGVVSISFPGKFAFTDGDESVTYDVSANLVGVTKSGVKTYLSSAAIWDLKK